MNFNIAIAPYSNTPTEFIIAALAYYQHPPYFSTYRMSLPYMREKMCAVVFIQHHTLVSGINTAVNRTIEKLLIRKLLTPENPPQVCLLVKPSLRGLSFVIPHTIVSKHWLLSATQKALNLWMQGE